MADVNGKTAIEFSNVTYRVPGGQAVLSNLDLTVIAGETLVLLGRSGSGKTTALKLVNHLLDCSEGEVRVEGKPTSVWDPIRLRRRIGYAIQEVGLFPHMTVEQNVALVPQLEGWEPERIRSRVNELLGLFGLNADQFRKRYPNQLSGGQRQRVGLARALASDPTLLLMDEPFGALDPLTRADIQMEFRSLQQRLKKTVVFVTHDVQEAMLLATRIAVLDAGRLLGVFSPSEFLRSEQPFVAKYVEVLRSTSELLRPAGRLP